ncbi:protein-tyrosine phosphatase family protein [Deferrisoma sp.]
MQPLYWLVADQIAAGPYPGSPEPGTARAKVRWIAGQGIGAFVDLTEPGELTQLGPLVPYDDALAEVAAETGNGLERLAFPIPDMGAPTPETMVRILDAMDERLRAGRRLYVHCLGGRGRTGVVLGCYLVRHAPRLLGTDDPAEAPERALRAIVDRRRAFGMPFAGDSPQSEAQFQMVWSWRVGR